MLQENIQITVVSMPWEVETIKVCTDYNLLMLWEEETIKGIFIQKILY